MRTLLSQSPRRARHTVTLSTLSSSTSRRLRAMSTTTQMRCAAKAESQRCKTIQTSTITRALSQSSPSMTTTTTSSQTTSTRRKRGLTTSKPTSIKGHSYRGRAHTSNRALPTTSNNRRTVLTEQVGWLIGSRVTSSWIHRWMKTITQAWSITDSLLKMSLRSTLECRNKIIIDQCWN